MINSTASGSAGTPDFHLGFQVRIPDPLECLPPRARRNFGRHHIHPHWSATATERLVQPKVQWAECDLESIGSIEPYYHITHRRKQFTFAYLSRKNGRTQTGESWWEYCHARRLEVDPQVADYQLGGLRITWRTTTGLRHYTPDAVRVDLAGHVSADEVKASASYFHESEYAAQMKYIEAHLAAAGMGLNKIDGDTMLQRRRMQYNVAKAFDDRFAKFGEREVEALHSAISDSEAGASVAEIAHAMHVHPASALQVINAMMCSGLVTYDLECPANSETFVRLFPKPKVPLPDIRSIQI